MADAPHIVLSFPHSLGAGGGGTIGCIQIARHLKKAGARVTVVTVTTMSVDRRIFKIPPLAPENQGLEQEAMLRDEGVEIVRVPPYPPHWYLDGVPTKRVMRRILAEQSVDAAFGWHHEYAFLPRLVQRAGAVSGLFVSGWYEELGNISKSDANMRNRMHLRIQRHLLLRSLRKVDVVFAISEFTKDEVATALDVPRDRITVAHWGVDPVFRNPDRAASGAIERFLFFGSRDIRKGGFETLEAFAEVARRGHRDWRLKLIWTRRDELERSARDKGIADQVEVLDPMDHESLARELAWAQVAILPSTFESFGLACAEAHVSGIPVIAYEVGGVHEVVRDGVSGWLVPNARPDLLPDAIVDALRDPERTHAMGCAGREHVRDSYTWDHTAATILATTDRLRAARA